MHRNERSQQKDEEKDTYSVTSLSTMDRLIGGRKGWGGVGEVRGMGLWRDQEKV